MDHSLLNKAEQMNKTRLKKGLWKRILMGFCAVVVFCTTYALILPALTMEGDPVCGQVEHIHTDSCYFYQPIHSLQCPLDGSSDIVHTHDDACKNEREERICTLPEVSVHTHGEDCYAARDILVCAVEESETHAHDEACTQTETVLICDISELQLHSHEESCYDAEGILICGSKQVIVHEHTEDCLVPSGEQLATLTCEIPEHIHVETCFVEASENEDKPNYLCGSSAHVHDDTCYDADTALICSIPVHSHVAACLVDDLDLNADVENQAMWESSMNTAHITGNGPTDVLSIAISQLGYCESARNVVLDAEGILQGYTRYGQWYGDPYGSWNGMFAAFCLSHGTDEVFPVGSDPQQWIQTLTEADLFRSPNAYNPLPGDLVFMDTGRVGILQGSDDDEISIIEGDSTGKVETVTYDLSQVTGYGAVPAGSLSILTHQGTDYTVTVSFTKEAGIPDHARLAVREILPDTQEYADYFQQSLDSLTDSAGTGADGKVSMSFARFFDISFVIDGHIMEPSGAVDVRVTYHDPVQIGEKEDGVAVHFAQDGIELLDVVTSHSDNETGLVDSFEFSQDSFSVVGTVVSTYGLADITTATRIAHSNIKGDANTAYVLYTIINNRYYAIDGNGYPVSVTYRGGTVTLPADNVTNLLWTFSGSNDSYVIGNLGTARHIHAYNNGTNNTGSTTAGGWASTLVSTGTYTFRLRGANNNYVYFPNSYSISGATTSTNSAATFYVAEAAQFFNVWFDGTNGGLMGLYGSDNTNQPAIAGSNGTATITLPETWKSCTKYDYTLVGWYDITTCTYYAVNPNDGVDVNVTISNSTVFYADWVASTYDVGQDNEHVVDSLDTNDFITTYVFDYNSLFNVQSLQYSGTITASSHTESWTIVHSGKVPYQDADTLDFMFVDYDADGDFSYAYDRDNKNINRTSTITAGIIDNVTNVSGGKDLLELLFDPKTDVIGKNYVGTGNYLYQYMDSTTSNYDGEHDGFYYLDAQLNAASYYQSGDRFYLYDYLERTSDSTKDGGVGEYSDFLPFNSPYLFTEDQLDLYTDPDGTPGYEYDAKDGESSFQEYNSTDDATTNYWFGIRSDIEFYLPNDTGSQDEFGNYGNISTRGQHMRFEFHGDDDLWVFIDGQLLLDVGGLHGVMFGEIDFSTGTVTSGYETGDKTTVSFDDIIGGQISEGVHTMSVYYMERGSSQSNCAIYFNIAPRYTLEITKEDVYSKETLDGTVFSIYTDESCDEQYAAQLWNSEAEYNADMEDGVIDQSTHTFVVQGGYSTCWGISAGKTYYIKETTPPEGYPANNDIIRITLNNRGTASIETTTIHGDDGATEGFAVIEQNVNETLKIVSLKLTNQKDDESTQIRVKKVWDANAADLPNSITVYLTVDGQRVGREAELTEANGWTYTWTGLPKYELGNDGELIEIKYEVAELQVPGFESETIYKTDLIDYVEWTRTEQMEDGAVYTLLNSGRALAYDPIDGFYWMTKADAQDSELGKDAQWRVTTNRLGFRLVNGNGYSLTYDPGSGDADDSFYGSDTQAAGLNQVIYFLDSRLVAYDHDAYFQFDVDGDAVDSDGLVFVLNRRDIISGTVAEVKNHLVDNRNQTYVDVSKEWADGLDHSNDNVTMHLYADGADTGRTIELNAVNGWIGSFEGLPYYASDGVTPVVYTIVEDEPPEYDARYEVTVGPGRDVVTWIKVDSMTDTAGIYRIVFAANALAIDSGGSLITAEKDSEDTAQWWVPVLTTNDSYILKSYTGNYYLCTDGDSVYTVTRASSASAVSLSGEALKIGNRYIQMTRTGIWVTEYEYNATLFTVAKRTEDVGKEGAVVAVTNIAEVGYELPATGSNGDHLYIIGGLLMAIAVGIPLLYSSNKRRKGDRASS